MRDLASRAHMEEMEQFDRRAAQRRLSRSFQAPINVIWDELHNKGYGNRCIQAVLLVITHLRVLQSAAMLGSNIDAKASCNILSTSDSVMSMPSFSSDVTPNSEMPHGTMPA